MQKCSHAEMRVELLEVQIQIQQHKGLHKSTREKKIYIYLYIYTYINPLLSVQNTVHKCNKTFF